MPHDSRCGANGGGISFDDEWNARKIRDGAADESHQRMSRGNARARSAQTRKRIAGEYAAGVEGEFAFPGTGRERIGNWLDLGVGNTEPDDIGVQIGIAKNCCDGADRARQCSSTRKGLAIAADDFGDTVSGGVQALGKRPTQPAGSDDRDRGMFHGARITERRPGVA